MCLVYNIRRGRTEHQYFLPNNAACNCYCLSIINSIPCKDYTCVNTRLKKPQNIDIWSFKSNGVKLLHNFLCSCYLILKRSSLISSCLEFKTHIQTSPNPSICVLSSLAIKYTRFVTMAPDMMASTCKAAFPPLWNAPEQMSSFLAHL